MKEQRFLANKHDNIYWYKKDKTFTFNFNELDRIPYKGNIHKYR